MRAGDSCSSPRIPGARRATNVYAAAMEKRLKQVLGQMEGETEVMITLSDLGETIVRKRTGKPHRGK